MAQASLEITVISGKNNQVVPFHPVVVENAGIGYQTENMTDAQGKIRLRSLSTSGAYRVQTSETAEYYAFESDAIKLRSNQSSSATIVLNTKGTVDLDEVVVRGSSISKINTVNAEVSSQLPQEEIEVLPIEGRDITRALYRLPNVAQATGFYAETPNVSINGSNGLYTNYLIDGLGNIERFLGGQKFSIPIGFTENITVLTNTFSAEYGLTDNGVVNITTRSGTNEVSGEVFALSRPGPVIDGKTEFAQRDLSGNLVKNGFQRYQGGFAVGGPIRKDKTFYYVNVEHTTDLKDNLLNVPELGVIETVRGVNNFTYLSGKIDHRWNDRFRSSLRVNKQFVNIERQGGGLTGGVNFPSAGAQQDRNSLIIASKNVYLGNGFSSETNLQYSTFRWDYAKADNQNSPQVTVLNPQEQTIAILGHPGYIFDDIERTGEVQQKFTFYRKNHTFKAGGQLISADFELEGGGNPNGNYLVKLKQEQLQALQAQNLGAGLSITDIPANAQVLNYAVELRPKELGARQNVFSFYVEDKISVNSRLNVALGLRYDYDNLGKGGGDRGDYNNIGPRTSVNYKLDERSSIRGGYGIFYNKILYAVYSDAIQFNSNSEDFKRQLQALKESGNLPASTDIDQVTYEGNITASVPNVNYLSGPAAEELQPRRNETFSNVRKVLNPDGYDNPYSHQFSLGYQLQLEDDKLFYVDLIHSRTYDLYWTKELNTPAPYLLNDPDNIIIRSQASADATRPTPIYTDAAGAYTVVDGDTLRGIARNVEMGETTGEGRYWGLSFNLVKEKKEDNYGYRLTYTLSRATNNAEGINFKAQDANNLASEWGPTVNDRTHIINAIYYYYPLRGLAVSAAALLQSGQPINRVPDGSIGYLTTTGDTLATADLNGDGRAYGAAYNGNSDRFPGESRNSDRLPWSFVFDVGLQYRLFTGQRSGLEFTVDVFNVFNVENLSGYSNNATQSNQIQIGSAASGFIQKKNAGPPRQFQFGLSYVF